MDIKPIKRSKHILALSKDHHFSLLFCWKIRQGLKNGIEAERIKKYVEYFWQNNLKEHFREEEVTLFAAIKNEQVTRAIADHRQIEEQVNNILRISSQEEANRQLILLADTVDAHIRFEERELFPQLEQLLTEPQLELIGTQLENTPAPKDDYDDEFWQNQKQV